MKEESLLLLSDLQKLINQVVLIDYTIIILGGDYLASIKEVAQKAGVGVGTVSRVLNSTGYVSDETRIKVAVSYTHLNDSKRLCRGQAEGNIHGNE